MPTQGDVAYYDVLPVKHSLIIDVHQHYDPETKGFLDELLASMETAGIRVVCLFTSRPDYGEREAADWRRVFRDYSERIVGFGTFNPGRHSVEVVDEYYSRGFKGLKAIRPTKPYSSDEFLPYYERAESLGMPILFHTGVIARKTMGAPEDVSSEYMRPAHLDRVARLFPKLKIIAAHMGDPWFSEAYMVSQKNPNMWLDISGKGIWLKALAIRKHLWIRLRPEKLVFGTDEPPTEALRLYYFWDTFFYEIGLSQEQRARIFGKTAAVILGLKI